jgi:hypothetical protein
MDNLELDFKLTVAQVNMILAHLAKGAYADVADLITHLHTQAKPQVEAAVSQAPASVAAQDAETSSVD